VVSLGEIMSRSKTVFVNLTALEAAAAPDAEILSDEDRWGVVDSDKWRIRELGRAPAPDVPSDLLCPSCDSAVPRSYRFCGSCGVRMDGSTIAPIPVLLSEPVHIVDAGVVADPAPDADSESTDLMALMMVEACSAPGFQEEPTMRTSYADIEPPPAVPPAHPKLISKRPQ
jgi:hypothetical protein